MDFSTALHELKQGNKIKRSNWTDIAFIKLEDGHVRSFQLAASYFNFDANILLSEDWIIEGTDTLIPFNEAINSLKEGKRVRLSNWKEQYIELDKNTRDIILKHYVYHNFYPSYESFIADDWEVINE